MPPPLEISTTDLHWLAGLLEGEGSFFPGPPSQPHLPVISIQMTDEDVMQRVGSLLGRKPCASRPKRVDWKTTYQVRLVGSRAVEWMQLLRPLMGGRRQVQIDRAIASYAPRDRSLLGPAEASAAIAMLADGASVREVAERFGTSVWCIYDLRLARTHKSLDRTALRRQGGASCAGRLAWSGSPQRSIWAGSRVHRG